MFKKGEKEDLTNWRPITLLNTDYKIFTKMLANRMRQGISKVIGEHQSCAVPKRNITSNLAIIRDIIWYTKERGGRLALISLDFEKAFDRVSYDFLFESLVKLGFPQDFVKWIKLAYTECKNQILVNGFFTEEVKLGSGVKQGCPLSPILFICALEPLLCAIKENKIIKGVGVPGTKVPLKVLAYMDDVSCFCSDTVSIKNILLEAEAFGTASGFKINIKKSEILLLGEWNSTLEIKLKITDGIKILGVFFDSQNNGHRSWVSLLERVKKNWHSGV